MQNLFGTIFGNCGQKDIEIHLCPGNSGDTQATTWTDDDGDYVFGNVEQGNYTVRQIVPPGFTQLSPSTPNGQLTYGFHCQVIAGKKTIGVNFFNSITQQIGIPGLPTFFVDNNGDDSHDGKTLATAWKTPKVIAGGNVVLSPQTFILSAPINFGDINNVWIGAADPANPAIISASYLTTWNTNSDTCILSNVTLTSSDGKGVVGNVHGKNISILNVNLGNLLEGFDYQGVTNLTILGGKQTGNTQGRCHYLIDVHNIQWSGGTFGPAQNQSPVRFSPPGVVGGLIQNVYVTQKGSKFPIACWAIHCASNVTFDGCISDSGDFSFQSAGDGGIGSGTLDRVQNCIIKNLTVTNAKLSILDVSFDNQWISGIFTNPTGECISVNCPIKSGNLINGAQMHSPKHGVHFYKPSDLVVSNSTLFAINKSIPIIDGSFVSTNNGGGNKTV